MRQSLGHLTTDGALAPESTLTFIFSFSEECFTSVVSKLIQSMMFGMCRYLYSIAMIWWLASANRRVVNEGMVMSTYNFAMEKHALSQAEELSEHLDHHSNMSEDVANSSRVVFVTEVVLIRHGQSFWNKFETQCYLAGKFSGRRTGLERFQQTREACKDACLTGEGVAQASNLQKVLSTRYGHFAENKVLLAGSGLSRAWDTLIVATGALRKLWKKQTVSKQTLQWWGPVHMVPSLMEFGNIDTKRKSSRSDDDPVYKADSIFGPKPNEAQTFYKNIVSDLEIARRNAMDDEIALHDAKTFYSSETSRGIALGVRVQKGYPRLTRDVRDCREQVNQLMNYFVEQSREGKTLILAGTHSNLIRCVAKVFPIFGSDGKVFRKAAHTKVTPANEDISFKENAYNIKKKKLPNGALLKLRLQIRVGASGNEVAVEFRNPEVIEVVPEVIEVVD